MDGPEPLTGLQVYVLPPDAVSCTVDPAQTMDDVLAIVIVGFGLTETVSTAEP